MQDFDQADGERSKLAIVSARARVGQKFWAPPALHKTEKEYILVPKSGFFYSFCVKTYGSVLEAITLSRGDPGGRRWRFWIPGDLPDQNTGSDLLPREGDKQVLAAVSKAK